MQKLLYYFMGLMGVITGICFIYLSIIGQYDRVLVTVGFESAVCFIFFVMLEPRPRYTAAQAQHDDKMKSQGLGLLFMIGLLVCIILFASSCSFHKGGWGCKGNVKSWKQVERRINRPY